MNRELGLVLTALVVATHVGCSHESSDPDRSNTEPALPTISHEAKSELPIRVSSRPPLPVSEDHTPSVAEDEKRHPTSETTVTSPAKEIPQAPFDTDLQGSLLSDPETRKWTSADGKFTTKARLRAMKGGFALLERQSGGNASVELRKLSRADYDYVCNAIQVNPGTTVAIGTVTLSPQELVFTDLFGEANTIVLVGVELPSLATKEGADLYGLYLNKVYKKSGWIEFESRDDEGRVLAHLFIDGRNVNLELVAEGLAWYHDGEAKNLRFANAEYVARLTSKGLWAVGLERPEH